MFTGNDLPIAVVVYTQSGDFEELDSCSSLTYHTKGLTSSNLGFRAGVGDKFQTLKIE